MSLFAEPSRAAGLRRLSTFVPHARAYADERNFDRGPGHHDKVSGLSPYLRHRLITEEEVLRAVLREHAVDAVASFVQEVFWRAYFKGYLEGRPGVWARYCAERDAALACMAEQRALSERYRQACEGRTGIAALDAWVRELADTGYLHNHARMWFASIWIFTLQLPWTLGADFMYRHLLDGDPASNTLSWRWVAGLHTVGKTYLARADNIAKYTNGRFHPVKLASAAPPLSEPALPAARAAQLPERTAWEGPAVLVLSEDDLAGSSLWEEAGAPNGAKPVGIAVLPPALSGISPLPLAPHVAAFKQAAMQEAVLRAAQEFGAIPVCAQADDPNALVDWAAALGARTLVLPHAPVGPSREQRAAVSQALYAKGLDVVEIVRTYDRLAWSHADRGFFKLKAQIPALLSALGLE